MYAPIHNIEKQKMLTKAHKQDSQFDKGYQYLRYEP